MFRWEQGRLIREQSVDIASLADIVADCSEMAGAVILTGDIVAKKIRGRMVLPANVQVAPAQQIMPRAANVAMIGLQRLAAGEQDNVMDLEPWYIRRSEAEVLWEKRHPEAKRCN